MTIINNTTGSKIIGLKPKLSEDQMAVVDVCRETLAQALEGNISSIGIIACMKAGYATIISGRQAADIYMACGSLQRKILNKVEYAGEQKMQSDNAMAAMASGNGNGKLY